MSTIFYICNIYIISLEVAGSVGDIGDIGYIGGINGTASPSLFM